MAESGARRPQESPTVQIGVGLFVSVAVVGFVWLLISLRLGPDRYPLVAEFDTLGGISEATKVKLRGFTVGQVESIVFQPMPKQGEAHFLVTLGIETAYPVPSGAFAEIRGSGLVGEAYVHLDVTTVDGPSLVSGAHIKGRSDETMKTLMTKIRDAAQKLGGAGQAIRNADLGDRLTDLTMSMGQVAADLGMVSRSADSLLQAGRKTLAGMEPDMASSLQNLDRTMSRLAVTMARADTLVAATSEDVQGSVQALRQLVERLDALLVRVDSVVIGKQAQLDETVDNVHATSAAVREITENPWRLITGSGDGQVAEEMGVRTAAEEAPE
jgi:phospholipid/cholesterol/gamma-HCH transport system substrate-binding protein